MVCMLPCILCNSLYIVITGSHYAALPAAQMRHMSVTDPETKIVVSQIDRHLHANTGFLQLTTVQ